MANDPSLPLSAVPGDLLPCMPCSACAKYSDVLDECCPYLQQPIDESTTLSIPASLTQCSSLASAVTSFASSLNSTMQAAKVTSLDGNGCETVSGDYDLCTDVYSDENHNASPPPATQTSCFCQPANRDETTNHLSLLTSCYNEIGPWMTDPAVQAFSSVYQTGCVQSAPAGAGGTGVVGLCCD